MRKGLEFDSEPFFIAFFRQNLKKTSLKCYIINLCCLLFFKSQIYNWRNMDEKQIIIRSVLDDAWEHPFPHPRNRLFDTMADNDGKSSASKCGTGNL